MDPHSKILTLEATDTWVAAQRASGLKIGFTCGAFDLLHAGHVQYLAQARQLCDRLLVAVNTDASVRRYKNPLRPFHPEAQRAYVVAGFASVDAVTWLDEDRPLSLILRWKPDLYIKGGDYSAASLRSADAVKSYGGRVEVIEPEFAASTSRLAEKIALASLHATPEEPAASEARALVLLDRDGIAKKNWNVNGVPATFVLDAKGRIRYSHIGVLDFSDERVASQIMRLLPRKTFPK